MEDIYIYLLVLRNKLPSNGSSSCGYRSDLYQKDRYESNKYPGQNDTARGVALRACNFAQLKLKYEYTRLQHQG